MPGTVQRHSTHHQRCLLSGGDGPGACCEGRSQDWQPQVSPSSNPGPTGTTAGHQSSLPVCKFGQEYLAQLLPHQCWLGGAPPHEEMRAW